MAGWILVKQCGDVHIIPIDDGMVHDVGYGYDCDCNPRTETHQTRLGNEKRIVVHMAQDGRHALEEARDVLNGDW